MAVIVRLGKGVGEKLFPTALYWLFPFCFLRSDAGSRSEMSEQSKMSALHSSPRMLPDPIRSSSASHYIFNRNAVLICLKKDHIVTFTFSDAPTFVFSDC